MGRPSLREKRRRELAAALVRVLAEAGNGGATVAAVASAAKVPAGLVHHYFADKQELYAAGLELLVGAFHARLAARDGQPRLEAYADAALALDASSDIVAARAWVGFFAAAISDRALFQRMRRLLDAEIAAIQRRSGDRLSTEDASAVLAFVVGALVFGAFAPRRASGFAAPSLRKLLGELSTPVP
jgi:TetR/AcrR family transcriptional repressor of bet genes